MKGKLTVGMYDVTYFHRRALILGQRLRSLTPEAEEELPVCFQNIVRLDLDLIPYVSIPFNRHC